MDLYEDRQNLNRTQAAQRLRELAQQIEAGRFAAGGADVAIPDALRFKLDVDHDEIDVTVKWRR